jgi:flagellar basal-body rod protein FlgB
MARRAFECGRIAAEQEGAVMSMAIASQLSEEIVRYLDLAAAEAKLTAANMANLDTPGYRALGMDFEAEMREAMDEVAAGRPGRPVRVRQVDGLVSRPDGNDVSMDREGLNLAEAQLRFRAGVALLREQYQETMDAIKAGS